MKLLSKKQTTTINITNDTIFRVIVITVLAIIGFSVLKSVAYQLTLIAIAAFLALALNPAVGFITKRLKISNRALATGLAYLTILIIITGILIIFVPSFIRQTNQFTKDLPRIVNNFQDQDTALARAVRRYNLTTKIDNYSHDLTTSLEDVKGPLINTASRIGGTVLAIITVLVLTFMMLIEGPIIFGKILAMQPPEKRQKRHRVAMRMYRVVTGYVNGQLLIALIAAIFASIALTIGNRIAGTSVNVIALSGIVFLFGLIPLIGNTIGAVLVCLFCLFSSTGLALGMGVYFLIYQQIENISLQPLIQSRSNQLTPLLVFIAALLGAGVSGLLGALVAIPVAGCLKVLFDEYFAERLSHNSEKAMLTSETK